MLYRVENAARAAQQQSLRFCNVLLRQPLTLLLLGLAVGFFLFGPASSRMTAEPSAPNSELSWSATHSGVSDMAGRSCRFIAFGDWGAGTPFQKNIAREAVRLRQKWPFRDVLMLGDNFYPDGDVQKYGKPYFTDMYAPLLRDGVRFIVALGNHDMPHAQEQIAFFRMPGAYYEVRRPPVTFFVLDTNTFATDPAQRDWLDRTMAMSKSPWKIVLGHHPIYSSGKHGVNFPLKEVLEPILRRHKADLYLAGHDHDYERFRPIHGVIYIVSGGGGAYLRGFPKIAGNSQVRLQAHHFLAFEARRNRLSMRAIDADGKLIDQAEYARASEKLPALKLKP